MISTKDLMIGNWVKNDLGEIQQVVEIHDDEKIMLAYNDFYSADELEPIPLTAEILEKNKMREFEHRNPGQGGNLIKKWWHKDGSYYVSLYRVGDKCTYTVGNSITRVCGIKYIHQLQHVLRLCGIEHEITL